MRDLTDVIRSCIEDRDGYPWFPSLTADLVDDAAKTMQREFGLRLANYGTARFLARDANGPRNIIATVRPHTGNPGDAAIPIEILPQTDVCRYEQKGAHFYSGEEVTGIPGILHCVQEAVDALACVSTVIPTVTALVRALHVLQPDYDDFDVSFSEPHLPFSAFVSVPRNRLPNDAMRVAEAILHEAMHLQLTLIERIVPLASLSITTYFSPWKGEFRNAAGVLHALYVFDVLEYFFTTLAEQLPTTASYGESRRTEINDQKKQIISFRGCYDLTTSGKALVDVLLSRQLSRQ